jgi:DNA-directed RNA polymerase subunit M/transcription elongation factor TFIIS
MVFCQKCHALLRPSIDGESVISKCLRCDYSETKPLTNVEPPQVVLRAEVLNGATNRFIYDSTRENVDHHCDFCGNDKAYAGEIKPNRFNDEQSVFTFTCTDCGKTTREYSSGSG